MATLNGGITSTAELIRVSGSLPPAGSYVTIDSEALRVNGAARGAQGRNFTRDYLAVDRGVGGTTKTTHSNGATLTRYYPEAEATGGGGGVTVTGSQGEGPFSATGIQAGTASDLGAGIASVGTCIISPTDPGAVGAGNFWLDSAADTFALYPLFVRDETDAFWIQASLGDTLTTDGVPVTGYSIVDADGNVVALVQANSAGSPKHGTVTIRASSALGDTPETAVTLNPTNATLSHTDGSNVVRLISTGAEGAVINSDAAISGNLNVRSGMLIVSTTGVTVDVSPLGAVMNVVGLPTADPVAAGQLWNDADLSALKVADPGTATAEDVATALNALIDALAGTLKVSAG